MIRRIQWHALATVLSWHLPPSFRCWHPLATFPAHGTWTASSTFPGFKASSEGSTTKATTSR
eukprot:3330806-Lingulodinium_polyedra.AAC.1